MRISVFALFVLMLVSTPFALQGIVVDENLVPIEGAVVSLSTDQSTEVTDSNGFFQWTFSSSDQVSSSGAVSSSDPVSSSQDAVSSYAPSSSVDATSSDTPSSADDVSSANDISSAEEISSGEEASSSSDGVWNVTGEDYATLFQLHNNSLRISLKAGTEYSIQMFNLLGRKQYESGMRISSNNAVQHSLPLEELVTGRYILRVKMNQTVHTLYLNRGSSFSSVSLSYPQTAVSKSLKKGIAGDVLTISKPGYISEIVTIPDSSADLGTITLYPQEVAAGDSFYRVQILESDTSFPKQVSLLFQVHDSLGLGMTNFEDCYPTSCDITVDGSGLTGESNLDVQKTEQFEDSIQTVLLIDNSSSIGTDGLDKLKAAAASFIRGKSDNQTIAIYSFASGVISEQTATLDTTELLAAVNAIGVAGSSTNLYGALVQGLSEVMDTVSIVDKKVIWGNVVVLTDGEDTQGSNTLQDVIDSLGTKEVFAVGWGAGFDATSLAQVAGNRIYHATDIDGVSAQFEQMRYDLIRETNSLYYMFYDSPKRGDLNHELILSVVGNNNTGADGTDTTFFNSAWFVDGYAAEAHDVLIEYRNDSLFASYTYFDKEGDTEGNSGLRWYINGSHRLAYDSMMAIPVEDTTYPGYVEYQFEVIPRQKYVEPYDGIGVRDTFETGRRPYLDDPYIYSSLSSSTGMDGASLVINHKFQSGFGIFCGIDTARTAYQWYKDSVAIPGATEKSYAPTLADLGSFIDVSILPVAKCGVPDTGHVTFAGEIEVVGFEAPEITSISFGYGDTRLGDTLSANYTYFDIDGNIQDTVLFQWYRDGNAIAGANSQEYVITSADSATYINVGATPVSKYGSNKTGVEVFSDSHLIHYLTDHRDGMHYGVVKIGDQYWFNSNLFYKAPDTSWSKSTGELYSWNAVLNGHTGSTSGLVGFQGVCPDGSHVAAAAEWDTLEAKVVEITGDSISLAAMHLKDGGNRGWDTNGYGVPANTFRFNARPGKIYGGNGPGAEETGWWTATHWGADNEGRWFWELDHKIHERTWDSQGSLYTSADRLYVRCVLD